MASMGEPLFDALESFSQLRRNSRFDGPADTADDSIPETSFPCLSLTTEELDSELYPLLINSDSEAANENLCTYFKLIVENLYSKDEGPEGSNYHLISLYALKLLSLNLFTKNYEFCIGKILSLLDVFTDMLVSPEYGISDALADENSNLKEFLFINLLLLLKLKNSADDSITKENQDQIEAIEAIDTTHLFETFVKLDFITIISNFIAAYITNSQLTQSSFVLLKFSCDIIFEYLFHVELLTDGQFRSLTTRTTLIQTLIKDLLANENFNNYDIDGDDFADIDKLIAYEEFKLLLLINEQYLMKSYSCPDIQNKVFEGLINGFDPDTSFANGIPGFINLLVYHINREESHIIKILILKFLYLVFTSSFTTKLPYVNDLKILVDIFIRELNNMEYNNEINNEHRILIITFLKVMYPLLMFSQLSELTEGYKVQEIIEMLRNLILNADGGSSLSGGDNVIVSLATKCLSISWLKKKNPKLQRLEGRNGSNDALSSSYSSSTSLASKLSLSKFQQENGSNDSLAASFTRIASMRASSRSDYHKHTTVHNLGKMSTLGSNESTLVQNNNHNIFLAQDFNNLSIAKDKQCKPQAGTNLLDLPKEYLKTKPLPPRGQFYIDLDANSSSSSVSSSTLAQKAKRKRAPLPPPLQSISSDSSIKTTGSNGSRSSNPPPPPPPRRRR